jgi:hypothetical protein
MTRQKYRCKKFYNTGPKAEIHKTSYNKLYYFLSILSPGANVVKLFYHGKLLPFLGIAVILLY